jgi:hypothetical protein
MYSFSDELTEEEYAVVYALKSEFEYNGVHLGSVERKQLFETQSQIQYAKIT